MELACVLEEATKEVGFRPLKAKQQEALEAFVFGRDTFVALPTDMANQLFMLFYQVCMTKFKVYTALSLKCHLMSI